MFARLMWGLGLAVLLPASVLAGETAKDSTADSYALAAKIDKLIAQRWADAKVQPAARADDAEYCRRVYLDLAGRIPTVAEVRAFLSDTRSDKRTRLVEQLLTGPRYTAHFTNVWRALLIPEAGNNFQVKLQQGGFEEWLRKQLAKNAGYDAMVRELLTAKVGGDGPGFNINAIYGGGGIVPYYLAKEFKPENLAAGTARLFLGVSVECAQCHNHPFADWKREQFWGFAAFFSGIQSQRLMDFLLPSKEDPAKHEIAIPGMDVTVQARFLDGTEPKWGEKPVARDTLADWVTSKENPYFARAAVNRAWAYFFGRGLVEPIDEMVGGSATNSHPDVIDLLAREFAGHEFDLKFLFRALTATQAYQLSSAAKSQSESAFFARMPLRGLTPEQLFDSVATATGYRDSGGGDDLITGILGGNRSARTEFLTKFARSERPAEAQVSILQALTLMNGKVTADATSLTRSETLGAVLDAPFLSTPERIETLYLATVSRKPTAKETERATKFIEESTKGSKSTYGDAVADVFWALLNSPEFVLNH
jgi:hypothetical protein